MLHDPVNKWTMYSNVPLPHVDRPTFGYYRNIVSLRIIIFTRLYGKS